MKKSLFKSLYLLSFIFIVSCQMEKNEQCRILKITSEYPTGEQKLFQYDSNGNISKTSYIGTPYGYQNYFTYTKNEVKSISFSDQKPEETYTKIRRFNKNGTTKEIIALTYWGQKDCTVFNYAIRNEINCIKYITDKSYNEIFHEKITFNDTKKLYKYYLGKKNDDSMTLYEVRTYSIPRPKSYVDLLYFEDYNHELLLESREKYIYNTNNPNDTIPTIEKRVTYHYSKDARGNIEKVLEEVYAKRSYTYEYECF